MLCICFHNGFVENHSDILIQIGDQSLSLLKSETERNSLLFDKYQNCSKKVVSFLLQDDRLSERGLLLLSRIYDGVWKNHIENKTTFITDIHFNILSDLIFDINEAIFILPTSKLEKLFRFKGMSLSRFSDNVLRINYCISDKESRKNEISACFYFLFSISNKISTSENIDKELWMRNIDNLLCYTANIKEEYKEEFEKDVVKTYFYYVTDALIDGSLCIAVNMNNLKIELREVTVIIRTPDFSDVGIKNISDPSNIPYDLLNGYQASFTESELHEYISMQNKMVEMYLKIAIECPDKDLGYYLD